MVVNVVPDVLAEGPGVCCGAGTETVGAFVDVLELVGCAVGHVGALC